MHVQILGSLVVRNARGSVIEIVGDRQRLLVALLAHRLGQTVPADVLSEAIWGAEKVRDPKAALHSLVARVRRTLEDGGERDALRTDPSGYRLDADRASVDGSRFEQLLGDADDAAPAMRAERSGGGAVALAGPRLRRVRRSR